MIEEDKILELAMLDGWEFKDPLYWRRGMSSNGLFGFKLVEIYSDFENLMSIFFDINSKTDEHNYSLRITPHQIRIGHITGNVKIYGISGKKDMYDIKEILIDCLIDCLRLIKRIKI